MIYFLRRASLKNHWQLTMLNSKFKDKIQNEFEPSKNLSHLEIHNKGTCVTLLIAILNLNLFDIHLNFVRVKV